MIERPAGRVAAMSKHIPSPRSKKPSAAGASEWHTPPECRPLPAPATRQPVERRNLRRHEFRTRYSELVKVCDEVVRAAGVYGTKNIDPRKKCVDADHDCP